MNKTWAVVLVALLGVAAVSAQSGAPGGGPGESGQGEAPGGPPPAGQGCPPPRHNDTGAQEHAEGANQSAQQPQPPPPANQTQGGNATHAANETHPSGPHDAAPRCPPPCPRQDEAREANQREACACPRPAGDDAPRGPPCGPPTPEHRIHIQFDRASDDRGLANYRVDGVLVLVEARWTSDAPAMARENPGVIEIRIGDDRVQIHDEPGGLLGFKGVDGSLLLRFPDGSAVEHPSATAARITLADGRQVMVRYDHATWTGDRAVRIDGFGSIHLLPPAVPNTEQRRLQAAIEERRLGAEVDIQAPINLSHPAQVQVLAYDDVEVNVTTRAQRASLEHPMEIRLESDLAEGRTVVLRVDPDLIAGRDGRQVQLRYFDERPDGTRTEVVFLKASNLQDVLDPTDDAGQPEYWITHDENGLHVLVSVPHWSAHVVTLAGIIQVEPNVLVGLAVGSTGAVLAAAALFGRRRSA